MALSVGNVMKITVLTPEMEMARDRAGARKASCVPELLLSKKIACDGGDTRRERLNGGRLV